MVMIFLKVCCVVQQACPDATWSLTKSEKLLNHLHLLKVCHMVVQEACPDAPWSLTFSYGRALQSATLKVPHSTLLVLCFFTAAQMLTYLSLKGKDSYRKNTYKHRM